MPKVAGIYVWRYRGEQIVYMYFYDPNDQDEWPVRCFVDKYDAYIHIPANRISDAL